MTSETWPRPPLYGHHCGQVVATPPGAHFRAGSGKILLDDVRCVGSKGHLGQGMHGSQIGPNCGHMEDAEVMCSGEGLLVSQDFTLVTLSQR
jgi:deleted-in-malignant-brain-tumors protein 1